MQAKIITGVVAALALSACAKRPDAIVPASIPMAAYSGQSCSGLSAEYIRESQTLAALSSQQNNAATGDALGVFLIGVPLSSMSGGDKEGMIAVSKGKVQAIESAMMAQGCNKPVVPKAAPVRTSTSAKKVTG